MSKIILEKGKDYDLTYDFVKKELKEIFGREFGTLEELTMELYKLNSSGVPRLPRRVLYTKRKVSNN